MGESTKHIGQRIKLVGILKDKGILDINVLDAISNIPRHLFMDSAFQNHAYQDKAFPIGENQTISQPYTVAFQTQELKLKKGMKILEIGTGSGYQTAVLCQMGANVFTIERQHKLYRKCLKILPKLGYNPKKIIFGDGYQGYLPQSPYDRIIVTAGSTELPKKLLSQL
ncbi:MAG: rRNA adenine N-6-methyltransferase family protein, partial [Bacteroidota bacterium]|nr:rRNA adenine N-6-methyltransferase family protein [Bacteroidota bacterium]